MFDDIINKFSRKETKAYNKEEYAKMKNEERQALYAMANETAEELFKSPENYKKYLDVQAQFDRYSVNNALLVSKQMPEATQLKEYKEWRKNKIYVKDNKCRVKILEPSDSGDGKVVYYNPKSMIDISQTNAVPQRDRINYSNNTMLKALLNDCPVNVKISEDLVNKNAEWNAEDKVLYVRKGLEFNEAFKSITKELIKSGYNNHNSKEYLEFMSNGGAYLVCKKRGIDISNIDIESIPANFLEMDAKDIKIMLSSMRDSAEEINNRIDNYLYRYREQDREVSR